jgi:hypothetical protein
VSLARITPFLSASTTVEEGNAVHTAAAAAERVRMELETISLTLRMQSDALEATAGASSAAEAAVLS